MAWSGFDSTYQSYQSTSSTARTAGVPVFLEDTVLVPLHDAAINQQCTLVYKSEKVTADKKTGAITEGDLVRIDVSGADVGKVSNAAKGATNTRCGFALADAVSAATTIDIAFDGRALYA